MPAGLELLDLDREAAYAAEQLLDPGLPEAINQPAFDEAVASLTAISPETAEALESTASGNKVNGTGDELFPDSLKDF